MDRWISCLEGDRSLVEEKYINLNVAWWVLVGEPEGGNWISISKKIKGDLHSDGKFELTSVLEDHKSLLGSYDQKNRRKALQECAKIQRKRADGWMLGTLHVAGNQQCGKRVGVEWRRVWDSGEPEFGPFLYEGGSTMTMCAFRKEGNLRGEETWKAVRNVVV